MAVHFYSLQIRPALINLDHFLLCGDLYSSFQAEAHSNVYKFK